MTLGLMLAPHEIYRLHKDANVHVVRNFLRVRIQNDDLQANISEKWPVKRVRNVQCT